MIRTMLVADLLLLRSSLATALSHEDGVKVVAEAACSDPVAPIADSLHADVAVVDLDPPGGPVAAKTLTEHCHLILLADAGMAAKAHRMLGTRVGGLLGKDTGPRQLAAAIRTVAGGDRVIDPALAVAALQASRNPLTAREVDVLQVAAEGASTAEIAGRLHLSRGTVRNYVSSALRKTGAANRTAAARVATTAGWL